MSDQESHNNALRETAVSPSSSSESSSLIENNKNLEFNHNQDENMKYHGDFRNNPSHLSSSFQQQHHQQVVSSTETNHHDTIVQNSNHHHQQQHNVYTNPFASMHFYEAQMRDHAAAYANAAANAFWAAAHIASGGGGVVGGSTSSMMMGFPPPPPMIPPPPSSSSSLPITNPSFPSNNPIPPHYFHHQHHPIPTTPSFGPFMSPFHNPNYNPQSYSYPLHHPSQPSTTNNNERHNNGLSSPNSSNSRKQKRSSQVCYDYPLPYAPMENNNNHDDDESDNVQDGNYHHDHCSSNAFQQNIEINSIQNVNDNKNNHSINIHKRQNTSSWTDSYNKMNDSTNRRRARHSNNNNNSANNNNINSSSQSESNKSVTTNLNNHPTFKKKKKFKESSSLDDCCYESTTIVSTTHRNKALHHYNNNNQQQSSSEAISAFPNVASIPSTSISLNTTYFHLIGKTGVSALYELCDKYHWPSPTFTSLPTIHTPNEFVISVTISNVEMSRGRGGTKKSAQQDAARKALLYIFPFIVFDSNGMVLDLGLVDNNNATTTPSSNTGAPVDGQQLDNNYNDDDDDHSNDDSGVANLKISRVDNTTMTQVSKNVLEDLVPNLVSRLAIHGGDNAMTSNSGPNKCDDTIKEPIAMMTSMNTRKFSRHDRSTSPCFSEDSSISTAVSMKNSIPDKHHQQQSSSRHELTALKKQKKQQHLSRQEIHKQKLLQLSASFTKTKSNRSNSFLSSSSAVLPSSSFCASTTTSGFSSASEASTNCRQYDDDLDDNEYYASRGASVCSALLHAMAQIDERIREPPSFTFDVRANPATIAAQSKETNQRVIPVDNENDSCQEQQLEEQVVHGSKTSTKRKGNRCGAFVSKRQSATNEKGKIVTIHRCSFACTASLTLHKTAPNNNNNNGDLAISSDDPDNSEPALTGESSRKDVISKAEEHIEHTVDTIEAVGTGATKREAKHVASAKLLALLFPGCNGMVEVKAAAEAARERYAASKALSKQSKSSRVGPKKRTDRKKGPASTGQRKSKDFSFLLTNKPPLPVHIGQRLLALTSCIREDDSLRENIETSCNDGFVSVANLSLSEPTSNNIISSKNTDPEGELQILTHQQFRNSDEISPQVCRQKKQLEDAVDTALQHMLVESDDDKRLSSGHVTEDDLGRTILRRATDEDCEAIQKLMYKTKINERRLFRNEIMKQHQISPLSLIGVSNSIDTQQNDDYQNLATRLWGNNSVIVFLSRALAPLDEPPLGYAVLTLGFTLSKGRVLRISELGHDDHLPKERFIEYLQLLSIKMNYGMELNEKNSARNEVSINDEEMLKVVRVSCVKQDSNVQKEVVPRNGNKTALQSVKEEDCEDEEEDKIDDGNKEQDKRHSNNHKRLKLQ